MLLEHMSAYVRPNFCNAKAGELAISLVTHVVLSVIYSVIRGMKFTPSGTQARMRCEKEDACRVT